MYYASSTVCRGLELQLQHFTSELFLVGWVGNKVLKSIFDALRRFIILSFSMSKILPPSALRYITFIMSGGEGGYYEIDSFQTA